MLTSICIMILAYWIMGKNIDSLLKKTTTMIGAVKSMNRRRLMIKVVKPWSELSRAEKIKHIFDYPESMRNMWRPEAS